MPHTLDTVHISTPNLVVVLRRLAYRGAHRALRMWWFVRRPRTRGVKFVLHDGDRVLFVGLLTFPWVV